MLAFENDFLQMVTYVPEVSPVELCSGYMEYFEFTLDIVGKVVAIIASLLALIYGITTLSQFLIKKELNDRLERILRSDEKVAQKCDSVRREMQKHYDSNVFLGKSYFDYCFARVQEVCALGASSNPYIRTYTELLEDWMMSLSKDLSSGEREENNEYNFRSVAVKLHFFLIASMSSLSKFSDSPVLLNSVGVLPKTGGSLLKKLDKELFNTEPKVANRAVTEFYKNLVETGKDKVLLRHFTARILSNYHVMSDVVNKGIGYFPPRLEPKTSHKLFPTPNLNLIAFEKMIDSHSDESHYQLFYANLDFGVKFSDKTAESLYKKFKNSFLSSGFEKFFVVQLHSFDKQVLILNVIPKKSISEKQLKRFLNMKKARLKSELSLNWMPRLFYSLKSWVLRVVSKY